MLPGSQWWIAALGALLWGVFRNSEGRNSINRVHSLFNNLSWLYILSFLLFCFFSRENLEASKQPLALQYPILTASFWLKSHGGFEEGCYWVKEYHGFGGSFTRHTLRTTWHFHFLLSSPKNITFEKLLYSELSARVEKLRDCFSELYWVMPCILELPRFLMDSWIFSRYISGRIAVGIT